MRAADPSFLSHYLAPLQPFLAQDDVTDIFVNRPNEVWVRRAGAPSQRFDAPALDENHLWRLARQAAAASSQGVSRAQPLLSAVLPAGARLQIVAPPVAREGFVLALRKPRAIIPRLSDYSGPSGLGVAGPASANRSASIRQEVGALLGRGAIRQALSAAIRGRLNIIVAGGTGSGKTTLLNALLHEIDAGERLVLIEDTPELKAPGANTAALIATRGEAGEAQVSADALLQAALRLRPDRILLGELRGAEALAFLRAVNTGHPGSLTSLHADNPEGALRQLAMMALQAGARFDFPDLLAYARETIDLIIQLDQRAPLGEIAAVALQGEMSAPT